MKKIFLNSKIPGRPLSIAIRNRNGEQYITVEDSFKDHSEKYAALRELKKKGWLVTRIEG